MVQRVGGENVSVEICERVLEWCYKHPSDISAWSFLEWVWDAMEKMGEVGERHRKWLQEVEMFDQNIAPGHEAVRYFVKMVKSKGTNAGI